MDGLHHGGPPDGFRDSAFTLIEIIVAMTIIAVVAAVAVPTLKGMHREEQVRAPLVALAEMVQEVRGRAIRERRPYEIVFERDGLHAIPGNPSFARREEFLQHLGELRTPPLRSPFETENTTVMEVLKEVPQGGGPVKPLPDKPGTGAPAVAPGAPELPWTLTIGLDSGMGCEVLMWGDGEWETLEGDGMRRWVFQANGMASPARVRLSSGNTGMEAGFDLLTGEMTGERSLPKDALR